MTAPRLEKLRHFIHEVDRLHREHHQTAPLLDAVAQRLAALVRYDDWLPEEYTLPHPHHYQQYLLHADSGERFSIVSFVWGPGQATPIHDHRVWGAIGMLRGAEENQRYQLDADGIRARAAPPRFWKQARWRKYPLTMAIFIASAMRWRIASLSAFMSTAAISAR